MSRLPDYATLKRLRSLTREDKKEIERLIRETTRAARRTELHAAKMAWLRGNCSAEKFAVYLVTRESELLQVKDEA